MIFLADPIHDLILLERALVDRTSWSQFAANFVSCGRTFRPHLARGEGERMTDTKGMREVGKGQNACKRINVKRGQSAKKDGTRKGP